MSQRLRYIDCVLCQSSEIGGLAACWSVPELSRVQMAGFGNFVDQFSDGRFFRATPMENRGVREEHVMHGDRRRAELQVSFQVNSSLNSSWVWGMDRFEYCLAPV